MASRTRSTVAAALRGLGFVARVSPRQFLAAAALQVLGAVAALSLVFAAKLVLDSLVLTQDAAPPTAGDVVVPLAVLAVATALSGATSRLKSQQQRLLAEDVATATWRDLLTVTGRVDLSELESPSFAERSERLRNNAINRPYEIADSCLGLLGSALTVVTLVIAVLTIEPLLVPVLLLAGLPNVLLARRAGHAEVSFARRWSAPYRLRDYCRRLLTDRQYGKEVRSFQLQGELERRHLDLAARYRAGLAREVRRQQRYALVSAATTGLVLAAALAVIVWLVGAERMDIAEAGAAVIAVRLLSGALSGLFGALGSIIESSLFLQELHDFVAEADPGPQSAPTLALREGITLRKCSYRYPGTEVDALTDVDLEILPGQLVALVGENGSGKSTLGKVVAGLYPPSSGELLWDGRPVDAVARAAVRRSVSAIFQDFVRYDLSAADNVELAAEHDRERLFRAVRAAAVDDVVLRLPDGLDTILGRTFEGAIDLSGGEWQRIALARALVRDAPVLVLDEPSSALDPRAEYELFSDLRGRVGRRAVLLISHRYTNLHLADRIYVLQDGRVVDHGTHEELISAGGLYAQLYGMQLQGYATTAIGGASSRRSTAARPADHAPLPDGRRPDAADSAGPVSAERRAEPVRSVRGAARPGGEPTPRQGSPRATPP